jgi:hypothetical protein
MSDHPRGRFAGWILIAVAGLAIAVALSVAASNLSTQPIGLSGEPLRAGVRLAPAAPTHRHARPQATPTTISTQTATTPTPTTPASTPTYTGPTTTGPRHDDHGGGDPDHDDD